MERDERAIAFKAVPRRRLTRVVAFLPQLLEFLLQCRDALLLDTLLLLLADQGESFVDSAISATTATRPAA